MDINIIIGGILISNESVTINLTHMNLNDEEVIEMIELMLENGQDVLLRKL